MFNPVQGIEGPFKIWDNVLKNRNNTIASNQTKLNKALSISYPYGKKCYYISPPPQFVCRLLSNQYGNANCGVMGTWMNPVTQYNGSTVADWENSVQFTRWIRTESPVTVVHVAKVKDTFSGFSNYSEMKRGAYVSDRDSGGEDIIQLVSGVSFDFAQNPNTDPLYFSEVKPLSDIGDKYVITGFDNYFTHADGQLPRHLESYFTPIFLWNTSTIMSTASGINQYHTVAPVGVETLFPVYSRKKTTVGILEHNATLIGNLSNWGLRFDDELNTLFTLTIGFEMCHERYTTGYFGILNGAKCPNAFNTTAIVPHNYNNGDVAPANLITNKNYPYITRRTPEKITGVFSSPLLGNGSIVFDTLDDVKALFEDFGIVVTFSVDEALYFPVSEISGGVPSGYDTNTTPNVDSNPDNNTDDFDVGTGNNPAEIACDTNIFSSADVSNLLTWFTTPDFYDKFSRLFNDPLSAIISLKYYPFDIVRHDPDHTTATSSTKIVNVVNPNIGGYKFIDGYNSVINGGELAYTAYYGNWADWACCQYDLYLPYLGIVNISPSAIVNKTIRVFYNVDFITGNAQIFVKTYDPKYQTGNDPNGQLVYTTMTKICVDIPITYTNWNEQLLYTATSALRAISGIRGGVTSGAASGAQSGGTVGAVAGAVMGGLGSGISSGMDFVASYPRTEYGAKGDVGVGILSPQDCYLLTTRKILAIPADGYGNISGNPSAYYGLIKSASGYVRATSAKCDGIPATSAELSEIAELLSAGIYI